MSNFVAAMHLYLQALLQFTGDIWFFSSDDTIMGNSNFD